MSVTPTFRLFTRRRSQRPVAGVVALLIVLFVGGCSDVVLDPVPPSAEGTRVLAPSSSDTRALTFSVIGDWGRHGAYYQDDVAERMGIVADAIDSRFVISTGDNFYDEGVSSIYDSAWETAFEQVYDDASLMTPWYVTLGNHDHEGNVEAQIQYTQLSARWTLPSTYYSITQPIDDTTNVRFLFIDTQPIIEQDHHDRRQLRWIDSTLAASTAAWTIVVGHHPIYSGGAHGSEETLVRALMPILTAHQVDAYIAGHEHDLQHLYDGSLHYFVSGAGSKLRATGEHAYTQFGITRPGFMVAALDSLHMRVQFIDHEGHILYETSIARREDVRKEAPRTSPTMLEGTGQALHDKPLRGVRGISKRL